LEAKIKILAVDDEKFNLDLLCLIFEDSEFEVVRAQDGLIAMQKLAEVSGFRAILLDRMMPNMDGLQMLRAVKEDKRFRHIPVILQSAAGKEEDIEEGIRLGADGYLVKPYDGDAIIKAVRDALSNAEARKANAY
jgi:CheY-like chemotaxis protein